MAWLECLAGLGWAHASGAMCLNLKRICLHARPSNSLLSILPQKISAARCSSLSYFSVSLYSFAYHRIPPFAGEIKWESYGAIPFWIRLWRMVVGRGLTVEWQCSARRWVPASFHQVFSWHYACLSRWGMSAVFDNITWPTIVVQRQPTDFLTKYNRTLKGFIMF